MDLLNINSPKFLGGTNVHNLAIIALLAFAAYKLKQFSKLKNTKALSNQGYLCFKILK